MILICFPLAFYLTSNKQEKETPKHKKHSSINAKTIQQPQNQPRRGKNPQHRNNDAAAFLGALPTTTPQLNVTIAKIAHTDAAYLKRLKIKGKQPCSANLGAHSPTHNPANRPAAVHPAASKRRAALPKSDVQTKVSLTPQHCQLPPSVHQAQQDYAAHRRPPEYAHTFDLQNQFFAQLHDAHGKQFHPALQQKHYRTNEENAHHRQTSHQLVKEPFYQHDIPNYHTAKHHPTQKYREWNLEKMKSWTEQDH
jgi:hypothetical protein